MVVWAAQWDHVLLEMQKIFKMHYSIIMNFYKFPSTFIILMNSLKE